MTRKITEQKLPFTQRNIRRVISAIKRNLSDDLLPKKWRQLSKTNSFFGHCHNASGTFYKIFGSKNCHLYRALDTSRKLVNEDVYHWWIVTIDGEIIDITEKQYESNTQILKKLYKNGKKAGLLGFSYKQRVHIVLERVSMELQL
jgi:hypothetical protein